MKTIIKFLFLSSLLLSFTVSAAEKYIELEDESKILGKWMITAEVASLKIKDRKKLSNLWTFKKGGVLTAVSVDSRMGADKTINLKYSIENGVIKKQSVPGREKYETCKVIKLDGKDMLLHCKFLYFFLTKQ